MHDWNWHNWGMPMMWFIWIPLIILVVWLIIRLTNRVEVLKRRYASGEITAEEYEQRKKVLEK